MPDSNTTLSLSTDPTWELGYVPDAAWGHLDDAPITAATVCAFLLGAALIILLALALGYLLASANTEAWYAANTLN